MGLSGHTANLPRSLGLSVCLCYVLQATAVHFAMCMSSGRNALEMRQIYIVRVSGRRTAPTIRIPPHLLYYEIFPTIRHELDHS